VQPGEGNEAAMNATLSNHAPTSTAPQSLPLAELEIVLRGGKRHLPGAALADLLDVFTDGEGEVRLRWLFDP